MQCIVIYPAAVLAVYDLSHKPEVFLQPVRDVPELAHESVFEHICSIKTDAVYIEFRHPETNGVKMILSHLRLIQVELREQIMATPVIVGKAIVILVISPEVYVAVPVSVPAVLTVLFQIAEGKEPPSRVIEHAVQDHMYAILMAVSHQFFKVFVISKSLIKTAIVFSIVSMRS